MTVVVKDPQGKIYSFTKGADTSVEPLVINKDILDQATLDDCDNLAE